MNLTYFNPSNHINLVQKKINSSTCQNTRETLGRVLGNEVVVIERQYAVLVRFHALLQSRQSAHVFQVLCRPVEHVQQEPPPVPQVHVDDGLGAGGAPVEARRGRVHALVRVQHPPDLVHHRAQDGRLRLPMRHHRPRRPSLFRVVQDGHHELDGHGGGDHGNSRPGNRALLVEGAVVGGVAGGDDVGAEVAAELVRVVNRLPCALVNLHDAVPDDEVGVEPDRAADHQLPGDGAQQRWQPPALPGVHQQEDDVVVLHQLRQPVHVRVHLAYEVVVVV